jgi:hypothetical protein
MTGIALIRLSLILVFLSNSAFGQDFELEFHYNEAVNGAGEQVLINHGRLLYLQWEKFGQPDSPITPSWTERTLSQDEYEAILELLSSFEISSWENEYEDVTGIGTTCSIYSWSLRFRGNGLEESKTGLCSEPPDFDRFRAALVAIVLSKHNN